MDSRSALLLIVVSVLAGTTRGCQFIQDKVYGGTFANCTRRHLTDIPADLPAATTSLDLSNNNISLLHFPKYLTNISLKYLDISHNRLSFLQNGTFEHVHRLRELYLNNNNLTLDSKVYPDDIFLPLENLGKLHLESNDKQEDGRYPENIFRNLKRVQELKIDTFRSTQFGKGFSHLLNLQRLLLGFKGCKLQELKNTTFIDMANLPVELLDLDNCPIGRLEIASFLPLKNLRYLHMSNIYRLEPKAAMLAMYGLRGKNLTSIIMNNIFTNFKFESEKLMERILSDDVMVYMKDVCVEKWSMKNNQILWVRSNIKNTVISQCLRYIDLSENDLYGDAFYVFSLSMFPNLVSIDISNRNRNPRGVKVDNANTTLSAVELGITVPKTLQVLNIGGFTLKSVPAMVFSDLHIYNATSLRHASIDNNGMVIIDPRVTGVENLTSLDISKNNCSLMNPNFFDSFPNLEVLSMIDVVFGEKYLWSYGKRLMHPMTKLKKVNLSNNNIKLLIADIFSSNQMEAIILSYNRFETIPFDLKTTPNLHHLDLSFNSLAVLSDAEMKLLDILASRHNLTLNLQGNLLSCGCQNLDFIQWLHNTNVEIVGESSYICQMSDGTVTNTSYVRDNYEEIWFSCNGRISLAVTIALLSLFLLVIMALYLTMKRKTLLVNIFLRMFGYGPLPQLLKKTDFLNDAYLAYSDTDYQYICHTVRDHLETQHGLKLFIRDRDTIPGGQIADDIISGIDSSWRTVLFLTAAFLNDEWCHFTINRVVYSSGRMPPGSILLVLFDDANRGDIDPALLNVVEERNIFYVERYIGEEERMWRSICEVIEEKV